MAEEIVKGLEQDNSTQQNEGNSEPKTYTEAEVQALLQAEADNSSHLAVLNYENKFNDIILDAGPITQEEYDEINATAEYVLGGVE